MLDVYKMHEMKYGNELNWGPRPKRGTTCSLQQGYI